MAHRGWRAWSRARRASARIVTGGAPVCRAHHRPTLIADVDERSVYRDEIRARPTVRTFTDDDDALRQANDTEYGLAASV
jgi:betaine-aldehyde dehydrogenase